MSVRRGQPKASEGPRLRGWVSFSLLDLPGVLGLRSREGCESQAILYRSREQGSSLCPPLAIMDIEGLEFKSNPINLYFFLMQRFSMLLNSLPSAPTMYIS